MHASSSVPQHQSNISHSASISSGEHPGQRPSECPRAPGSRGLFRPHGQGNLTGNHGRSKLSGNPVQSRRLGQVKQTISDQGLCQPGSSISHASSRTHHTSGRQHNNNNRIQPYHKGRSTVSRSAAANAYTTRTTDTKTHSSKPSQTKTITGRADHSVHRHLSPREQNPRPSRQQLMHTSGPQVASVNSTHPASSARVHRYSSMTRSSTTSTSASTSAQSSSVPTGGHTGSFTSHYTTSQSVANTTSVAASTCRLPPGSDSGICSTSSLRTILAPDSATNVPRTCSRPSTLVDRSSQTQPVELTTLSAINIQLDRVTSRSVSLQQTSTSRDDTDLNTNYHARPSPNPGRRDQQQLPDILNSHVAPPYQSRSAQRRLRSREGPRPSQGQTILGHHEIECCPCRVFMRCITMATTFRCVLVTLALLGGCCVVAGIILGTLHMTLDLKYRTFSLMFIGKFRSIFNK